jgi:hypothetical protein
MATKGGKNIITDWYKIAKFTVFCISCIVGVILWHFSGQSDMTDRIADTYVTKTELQLVGQKLESVENSLEDFKIKLSDKLESMEATNEEVIELITDIRLTLARKLQ